MFDNEYIVLSLPNKVFNQPSSTLDVRLVHLFFSGCMQTWAPNACFGV